MFIRFLSDREYDVFRNAMNTKDISIDDLDLYGKYKIAPIYNFIMNLCKCSDSDTYPIYAFMTKEKVYQNLKCFADSINVIKLFNDMVHAEVIIFNEDDGTIAFKYPFMTFTIKDYGTIRNLEELYDKQLHK